MSIDGKFGGMPVQPQPILTAVQVSVCEQFFPVFAQLYLMKHAWLPTTQGIFLQYAHWTHRNKSELDLLRTKVMFVANHPKQGNLLKGYGGAGGYRFIITMDVCWVSGLNKHALVKEYWAAKPGWPSTAIQLQKQTSACSYLRFLHLNDPGGRHNDSSVSPQGTWLLNVV